MNPKQSAPIRAKIPTTAETKIEKPIATEVGKRRRMTGWRGERQAVVAWTDVSNFVPARLNLCG